MFYSCPVMCMAMILAEKKPRKIQISRSIAVLPPVDVS